MSEFASRVAVHCGSFSPIAEIEPEKSDGLSNRQRQVRDLIVQGASNKEIARALKLSEGTVKIHVSALFRKIGVHHRSAIAVAAGLASF